MTTFVATIDHIIQFLESLKEDGYNFAVLTNDKSGNFLAPSTRRKYYQVGFAISESVFPKKDLKPLLDNPMFAFAVFKDVETLAEKYRERLLKDVQEGEE